MANQLTMAASNAILTLHKSGHSRRAIARMLRVHRDTVARHLAQNRPIAPTGSEAISETTAGAKAGGESMGPTGNATVGIDGSTTEDGTHPCRRGGGAEAAAGGRVRAADGTPGP